MDGPKEGKREVERKEGKEGKEGKKEGRKEGRKERRKERRKEKRKKEGKKERKKERKKEIIFSAELTFEPHQSQNLASPLLTRKHLEQVMRESSSLGKGGAETPEGIC